MAEYGVPFELVTAIGSLAFNVVDETNGYLRLSAVSGLQAAVRAPYEPVPQRDGAIVHDFYRGALTPILEGEVVCETLAQRATLMDSLRAHAAAILRADGVLKFTPSGKAQRRIQALRCLEALQIGGAGFLKTFQLALITGDPLVYSEAQQTAASSALTAETGGDWGPFPHGFPEGFGESSSGGIATAVNGGNVATFPVLKVFGPLTAPLVQHVDLGHDLSFSGLTISAGDFVEIDCRQETVLLNGSPDVSLLGKLDVAASEFFSLEPGSNSIRLSGTGFTAATRLDVVFRDAWA